MKELRIDGLKKSYGKRTVVKQVSLYVRSGEIVGLLGPNGAGKTTSFYMIIGAVLPEKGTILLNDIDITNYPMYKRARLGIGYLPQETSVFQKMSVKNNLMSVLEFWEPDKAKRKSRAAELMEELSLTHVAGSMAYTLSGGERRKLEFARALITNPSFLLLDEPFSGIDPITVSEIQKIIKQLKDKDIGIIITDHNVRDTLSITDHSYVIYEGEVLISGNSNYLINNPTAKKIYLGEEFKI